MFRGDSYVYLPQRLESKTHPLALDPARRGGDRVLSVLALVELHLVPPLIATVLFAFLSIRLEGASILDFLRCAVCFLFLKQQYYEWRQP